MPTSVPMMPSAGELHTENLLYLIQGSGTDRDRRVTLGELREFCTTQGVELFELDTASASSGTLSLALGAASTSAFVAVSGTLRNHFTLEISGSVPAGCQLTVVDAASGFLKITSSDATINGIDASLELTAGDSALLGRGTGTVWWGSATRSAAAVDAAVTAEKTRAEEEEASLSQAITAEANARASAITAEASARAGITAKAVRLNIADADPTTGVLVLNASEYACDLHVEVSGNPTSNPPPASPGYFTLQVDGALPAGCSIRIRGGMSGASWTTSGTLLPVQVHFTSSYSYGLGDLAYPYPAWLPLVEGGDLSAVVMYDGQTWCGNSTDLLALIAYNNAKAAKDTLDSIRANQYLSESDSGTVLSAGTLHTLYASVLPSGRYWFSALINIEGVPDLSGELYQAEIQRGQTAPIGTVATRFKATQSTVTLVIPGTLVIANADEYVCLMLQAPESFYQGGSRTALYRVSGFRICDY